MWLVEVKRLLSRLQKFGLPELEVKLYLTLLAYGTLTAVQAADRSGIPRPRAYDELASLERKGLVARAPVKPIRYTAVSPVKSFRRLLSHISREYSTRVEELSDIEGTLVNDLQPIFEKRVVRPTDIAWIVSGANNLREELLAMLSETKKRLFVSYDPPLDPFHRLRGLDALMEKLRGKGVKIAALFDLSAPAIEHAEELKETLGSGIRFGKRPFKPLGIYAREGKSALVAYQSGPASTTYDIALNLVESPLTTMLSEMVMQSWERGIPFAKARGKLGGKP